MAKTNLALAVKNTFRLSHAKKSVQCFESNFVNIDFDQNTDGTLELGLQGAKLFLIENVNCNIGQ